MISNIVARELRGRTGAEHQTINLNTVRMTITFAVASFKYLAFDFICGGLDITCQIITVEFYFG